jgi:dihydrofolate synthase/folylpolyglutamate synthase
MEFAEAWAYLDQLQFFKIKLGLESMTRLMERLGSPHQGLAYLHIAGTNGKGSVGATLLTLLAKAGFKVGLYTSPHLSSVRERFRINDRFISPEEFARHASQIREVLARDQITYFEFTTALALLWFAAQKVDFVLMEVGMGGRLDATNIIRPRVAIITNVAMDHEAYLGTTLAAIAAEKAGIIKPGVPVVSGVVEPAAAAVIRQRALEAQAPLFTLGAEFAMVMGQDGELDYQGISRTCPRLRLGLAGAHQAANTALALAALELLRDTGEAFDEEQIRNGLPAVRWPGRLEFFPSLAWQGKRRPLLLDGAHNPAGVEALCASLRTDFPHDQLIMVWASMGDKDFQGCVATVAPLCRTMIFTRPEELRSATPEALQAALPAAARAKAMAAPSVAEALTKAYALAGPTDLICVAGSLYLIGKARSLLVGELVDE